MRLAPGASAKSLTRGMRTVSAMTAVPAARVGTRLDGGATPLVTHSSSAWNKARNAGVALCGVRGVTHGGGRLAGGEPGPGARLAAGPAAMLGPGDQVDPRIRRQFGVGSAARVGVHQRGALLPIFGRSIGLDGQRVGRVAVQDRAGMAGERVAGDGIAEREPVFGIEPVLVLGRGAAGHAEAVVGEHLAGAGDMAEDAIEDAAALGVAVHAKLEEMPQEAAALRHPEADRVTDFRPLQNQWVVGALVAQKRDKVA